MIPLSVSTVVFDGHSQDVALAELAALGVARVEPAYISGYMDFDESDFADAAARACRARLAAAGLAAPAISAHIDLGAPGADEQLARRLRFAAGIGARFVITNAASLSAEMAARRCLERALPVAEASGVVVAIENPGHGRDAILAAGAAGAAFVAGFDSPWLRLNYDVANVLTYSEGRLRPEDDIAAALPALAHLHLKDVRATPEGWIYTPLGEGDVALDRIARALAHASLPASLELPLRLSRPRGGDPQRLRPPLPLSEIRAAVGGSLERMRRLMAQAEG